MKKIFIFMFIIISLIVTNVSARELNIYFYSNGGTTSDNGFFANNEYSGLISYDNDFCAVYKETATIKNINSINGKKFNLKKDGNVLVKGKEWYLKNNNKVYYFSQSKNYKTSDIMEKLGYSDMIDVIDISLYANWSKSKITDGEDISAKKDSNTATTKTNISKINTINNNSVIIQYNSNGGKLVSPHGNAYSVHENNNIVLFGTDNKKIYTTNIKYNKSLSGNGLLNYNNSQTLNLQKSGYEVKKDAEWNTKKDGTGKSFSQKNIYKASDFCDASKKDCTVTLYVNWKKEDKVKSITINPNITELVLNEEKYVTITARTNNNTPVDWESSNTKAVKVDKNGKIVGVKEGKATVTVTSKNNKEIGKKISVVVTKKNTKTTELHDIKIKKDNCNKIASKGKIVNAQAITTINNDKYVITKTLTSADREAAKNDKNLSENTASIVVSDNEGNKKIYKTGELGHVNGVTYNNKTKKLYIVGGVPGGYSYISIDYNNLSKAINTNTEKIPKEYIQKGKISSVSGLKPTGIAYDSIKDVFVLSDKYNLYVCKNLNECNKQIKKQFANTNQDIGAYNGYIYVLRYNKEVTENNSNINNPRNAIDMYDIEGNYLGSHLVKTEQLERPEIESLEILSNGQIAIFMQNKNDYDCIQKASVKLSK